MNRVITWRGTTVAFRVRGSLIFTVPSSCLYLYSPVTRNLFNPVDTSIFQHLHFSGLLLVNTAGRVDRSHSSNLFPTFEPSQGIQLPMNYPDRIGNWWLGDKLGSGFSGVPQFHSLTIKLGDLT